MMVVDGPGILPLGQIKPGQLGWIMLSIIDGICLSHYSLIQYKNTTGPLTMCRLGYNVKMDIHKRKVEVGIQGEHQAGIWLWKGREHDVVKAGKRTLRQHVYWRSERCMVFCHGECEIHGISLWQKEWEVRFHFLGSGDGRWDGALLWRDVWEMGWFLMWEMIFLSSNHA